MTSKELSQLSHLQREVKRIKQRIAELRSVATGVSSGTGGEGRSPGIHSDRTAIGADIADLEDLLAAREQECTAELVRLEQYIASISDSEIRQIMELRHCECLSWRGVAARLGWGTADSVRMMHDRFLDRN